MKTINQIIRRVIGKWLFNLNLKLSIDFKIILPISSIEYHQLDIYLAIL